MKYRLVTFSLHPVDDLDIIQFLDDLPYRKVSETVREIIREHMGKEGEHERMTREVWERIVQGWGMAVWGEPSAETGSVDLDGETLENLKGLGR